MSTRRPRGNPWPAGIIALAAVFLVALAGSLYWGITRSSPVSDADYYARGVAYDRDLRSRQAGNRQWTLRVRREVGELVVHLADRAGNAVSGAGATLTLTGAGSVPGRTVPLAETRAGEYRGVLPDLPPGGGQAVVVLRQGGAELRRPLLLAP